ncbi:MAG: type II toxin-antitoxin system RelE/ParE family toxin [Atribacterota bacterium]|nr:type II toxin-antitoxin system RelE/ParE family toxin [Atribacterota bacterium]MDD3031213.1 type II toxin-antitoxin system RelE/ParE family toxin [Atribacterota bacterium]MDD3640583.1 type II toxin-antitoxin system RelE/ParE family toxin [Atribacterota bacterium]
MGCPYKQSAYPKYNRIKKKFPFLFRKKLNDIEDKIAANPLIGEEKKVDIKGIRVHKFKLLDQQILLAYQVNEDKKEIIFVAVGGHEIFYRDLKRYMK